MLHHIVTPGMGDDMQEKLYEVFFSQDNFAGLAALAGLKDISPSVESKLAKINNATVRVRWMTREGRSQKEVQENLKSEKRVGILVALVDFDFDFEVYQHIASANKSHALALAVLNSHKCGREAHRIAARNLGEYVSEKTSRRKLSDIGAALDGHEGLWEVFASSVTTLEGVLLALGNGPYGPTASEHLAGVITQKMEEAVKWAQQQMALVGKLPQDGSLYTNQGFAVEQGVRQVFFALDRIDFGSLPPHTCRILANHIKDLRKLLPELRSRWMLRVITGLEVHDPETELSRHLDVLRTVDSIEEVEALLSGREDLEDPIVLPYVNLAVLSNKNIDTLTLVEFLGSRDQVRFNPYPGEYLFRKTPEMSVNGIAAFCLKFYINRQCVENSGKELLVIEELLRLSREGVGLRNGAAGAIISSPLAGKKIVAALPCDLLLANRKKMSAEAKEAFTQLVLTELGKLEKNEILQFDKMIAGFSGTLEELGIVCKATYQ